MIKLDDLLKTGWHDSKHRFSDLLILIKEQERILYDPKKQEIHSLYSVAKINEHPMGIGAMTEAVHYDI